MGLRGLDPGIGLNPKSIGPGLKLPVFWEITLGLLDWDPPPKDEPPIGWKPVSIRPGLNPPLFDSGNSSGFSGTG